MKIYPDNNIIIDLQQQNIDTSSIKSLIGQDITGFSYSSSHIYETDTIPGYETFTKEQVIDERLSFIDELTHQSYIDRDKDKELQFIQKSAKDVYKQIKDYPTKDKISTGFTDIMPFEARKAYRELLKINMSELTNLSGDKAIDYLNEKYKKAGLESFTDTLELGYREVEKTGKLNLYDKIAMIFVLLDNVGYYKDKETDKSDFARLWDANHAYYATVCDAFITNDKRTFKKTGIAYHLLQIKTMIISPTSYQ